jgi:serine/threonine protein kinase
MPRRTFYRRLKEYGRSSVYAARDGEREVALKVLHADLSVDDKQIERFVAEAERMRTVTHHALVPVLGAGCLPGGRPFIVMPRLKGRSLASRLTDGPLPLGRALALFEDVARAVAALHAVGLVHRDIKPENVFWLEQEDRLVLLDLGIAREIAGAPSTTTRAGFQRGTPAYMAPERLFGQSATVASDLYELGLLLCLMLTARLPWDEGDAMGRVTPKLSADDRSSMTPQLAAVILDALSFDAGRRPASASTLLERVQAASAQPLSHRTPAAFAPTTLHAQHTPALAPSVATASPAPPSSPRARGAAIALGTFVLGAGLAAGLAFGVPALRARSSAPAASPPEPPEAAPASASGEVDASSSAIALALSPAPLAPSSAGSAEPLSSAASAASVASASVKPSAPPIKEGTLPPGAIESRVRARMGAMGGCVTGEMKEASLQTVGVALNFWIGTNGTVTSASGKSKDVSRAAVDCVVGHIRGIAFPMPEGGPVNVIMPVRFNASR